MNEVPSYLVDQLIPSNQMHILAGASGAGKTTLLLQLLRDLLDGKPWFGHNVHPCSLAYIATDRPTEEHFEKFTIMNVSPFPIYSLLDNLDYRPGHLKTVDHRIEIFDRIWNHIERPKLTIIDPLSPFLPANLIDYHSVADSLVTFMRWCKRNQVTIIGTHHAAKLRPDTQYTRPQDRILGSSALQGYSGTHLFLADAAESKGGQHVLTIVPHNAKPLTLHFSRHELTGIFIPGVIAQQAAHEMNVLVLVPYEPDVIDTASLLQAASQAIDRGPETVERIIKTLLDGGRIKRVQRGTYSRLRMN